MAGGTETDPPQDSVSGPWWHEQKATATPKAKPSTKGKSKAKPSPLHVSLDNADTVIEGGPGLAPFETWVIFYIASGAPLIRRLCE